jgi:hypothetical protein
MAPNEIPRRREPVQAFKHALPELVRAKNLEVHQGGI